MFSMKRIGMAFAFCILLIGCAKKEQPATPKTADELSIEGEEAPAGDVSGKAPVEEQVQMYRMSVQSEI